MTNRRLFLKRSGVVSGAALMGALTGCLGDDDETDDDDAEPTDDDPADEDAITIGVLSMLEVDVGPETIRGAELAAEDINEAGGVLGRDVQVESADTEGTATAAVEAHSFLVDGEEAEMTLGAFSEAAAAGIMERIADTETIHINVGAVSPELSGQVHEDYDRHKYWFRCAPPNSMFFGVDILEFAAEFMVENRNWETVALLREDALWTDEVAPFLEEEFPNLGLEIVDEQVFAIGETNFDPYYSSIIEEDPDCIFGLAAEAGRAPLLGYVTAGTDIPLVGDVVAVQSAEYPEDMDGEGDYIVGRTHSTWSAQQTEQSEHVLDRWSERYDDRPTQPTWAGFGAYAAVQMWAAAVEAAGELDADAIVPEILEQDYQLCQRYELFGPDEEDPITGEYFPHDVKYGPEYYQSTWSQWVDGEQTTIWPEHLATGEFQEP